MDDATHATGWYHYRISAPPGVNDVRLTPRGWFEFSEARLRRLRREKAGRDYPYALPYWLSSLIRITMKRAVVVFEWRSGLHHLSGTSAASV